MGRTILAGARAPTIIPHFGSPGYENGLPKKDEIEHGTVSRAYSAKTAVGEM
jgi:hypothetical protein